MQDSSDPGTPSAAATSTPSSYMSMGDLRDALRVEQQRARSLERALAASKDMLGRVAAAAEVEEEALTLRLVRRLEELKAEKVQLALEVEREEEYITNSLRRALARVQAEKAELENRLEAEQEHIVNRLQKQLMGLNREKAALEQRIAEEARRVADARAESARAQERAKEALAQTHRERVEMEAAHEMDAEYLVNKLTRQLHAVQRERDGSASSMRAAHTELMGLATSVGLLNERQAQVTRGEPGAEPPEPGVWGDVLRRLQACAALMDASVTSPAGRSASSTSIGRAHTASPVSKHGRSRSESKLPEHAVGTSTNRDASSTPLPPSPASGARWTTYVYGRTTPAGDAAVQTTDASTDDAVVVLSAAEYRWLKRELSSMRNECFVLTQRLEAEQQRVASLTSDASRLTADMETDSERFFNLQTRVRSGSIESSGSALPRTPSSASILRVATPRLLQPSPAHVTPGSDAAPPAVLQQSTPRGSPAVPVAQHAASALPVTGAHSSRTSWHAGVHTHKKPLTRDSSASSLGLSPLADGAPRPLASVAVEESALQRAPSASFGSTASLSSTASGLGGNKGAPSEPTGLSSVAASLQHLYLLSESRRGSTDSFGLLSGMSDDGADNSSAAALSIAIMDDHDSHAHFTRTLRSRDDEMGLHDSDAAAADSDRERAPRTRQSSSRSVRGVRPNSTSATSPPPHRLK